MSQPLFFKHPSAFTGKLPSTLQLYSQEQYSSIPRFIEDYLSHYKIHALKDKHCQAYGICASTISTEYKSHPLNYTIVQQYWQAKHAIGTLMMVHGYMDHTGLYGQLLRWALSRGFNVVSVDLPGHGLSSGETASIDHFDRYSQVLDAVIKRFLESGLIMEPLYAVGQSTGCAVIANALIKPTSHPINKAVLLAPLVRSLGWAQSRWLYFMLKPFINDIRRKFSHASHNRDFNKFLERSDPLQSLRIPLQWLGAMESWYQLVKHYPQDRASHTPITVIQGTGDMTVDWRYNLSELEKLFTQYHIHYIPKARHQLVNESEHYWQAIEDILNSALDSSTPITP